MKIIVNTLREGFSGLSEKAVMRYAELKGFVVYPEITSVFTTYWLVPEEERED